MNKTKPFKSLLPNLEIVKNCCEEHSKSGTCIKHDYPGHFTSVINNDNDKKNVYNIYHGIFNWKKYRK